MEILKKIRVLVVDDSRLFREVVARGISADPAIEVVAVAGDPFEATDKILETRPDVITCDVEMPRMNGIEFVRRLLPQYFVPVVMVSALSEAVFDAMAAGAVDFAAKPDSSAKNGAEAFIRDLIQKIKTASTVKAPLRRPEESGRVAGNMARDAGTIIAIGASTGGTEAIFSILRALPPAIPGIVVVQHIPPLFSQMYAQRLDNQTALSVKEAESGDYAEPGRVLIAPGDRHMKLRKAGSRYRVDCFHGDKVGGHCPSVDVLFESVASQAGGRAVGILLTGMGSDGARGLLSIRRSGGRTIGQDEASSVVYGMPKAAYNLGAVEFQAPLGKIPRILFDLLS